MSDHPTTTEPTVSTGKDCWEGREMKLQGVLCLIRAELVLSTMACTPTHRDPWAGSRGTWLKKPSAHSSGKTHLREHK